MTTHQAIRYGCKSTKVCMHLLVLSPLENDLLFIVEVVGRTTRNSPLNLKPHFQ